MKLIGFVLGLSLLLAKTCLSPEPSEDRPVLAKVNGEPVYLDEALENMPDGLRGADSVRFVQDFLTSRIREMLVYDLAKKNVSSTREIDEMVEDYRRSLLVYEYQQRILNERITKEVSEEELRAYYEANKARFTADQDIAKGIFLKIPVNAPGVEQVRQWMQNPVSRNLQRIETYSIQNASIYTYFMDKWTSLDNVLMYIPDKLDHARSQFGASHYFETKDSLFHYMIYLDEILYKGQIAPYEYVRPVVMNVLMNARKNEFLEQFEQDLMRKAEQNGHVVRYSLHGKI
jgi:hypothetical protein